MKSLKYDNSSYPKILTVDDNELNRELISSILQKINLETDLSDGGQDALNKLSEKKYDILLLDMSMPEMSGDEVVREIRKKNLFNELYVIAVTADAMKGASQKYIDMGCDYYLSKPLDHKKLTEKISSLIAIHLLNVNNGKEHYKSLTQ